MIPPVPFLRHFIPITANGIKYMYRYNCKFYSNSVKINSTYLILIRYHTFIFHNNIKLRPFTIITHFGHISYLYIVGAATYMHIYIVLRQLALTISN